jgi:hypothetical protein
MALVEISLKVKRFALRTSAVETKSVVGNNWKEYPMRKTCRLGLLTWTYRDGHVAPQCDEHPTSPISVVRRERDAVVICEEEHGFWHQVKICPNEEFDAEQQEAVNLLDFI